MFYPIDPQPYGCGCSGNVKCESSIPDFCSLISVVVPFESTGPERRCGRRKLGSCQESTSRTALTSSTTKALAAAPSARCHSRPMPRLPKRQPSQSTSSERTGPDRPAGIPAKPLFPLSPKLPKTS